MAWKAVCSPGTPLTDLSTACNTDVSPCVAYTGHLQLLLPSHSQISLCQRLLAVLCCPCSCSLLISQQALPMLQGHMQPAQLKHS